MKQEFAKSRTRANTSTSDQITNAVCDYLWQHDFGPIEEYDGIKIISNDRTTFYFDKLISELLLKLLPEDCTLPAREIIIIKAGVEAIHTTLTQTEAQPRQPAQIDLEAHKLH